MSGPGSRYLTVTRGSLNDERQAARAAGPASSEAGDTVVDGPTKAASPAALAGSLPPPSAPSLSAATDASAPSLGGSGASIAPTSIAQPLEALRRQEIARTRSFLRMAFALAVLVGLMLLVVSGDPTAKAVLGVAIGTV